MRNVIGRVRATSWKLIMFALMLFATTITVLTQREVNPVSTVHLCVKDNGQLRLTNNNTCNSSERLTEWVVGGEVTNIQPGQGLIGTRNNGTVNLALDPAVFQSCSSCGKIFAGFNDGPLPLPRFIFGEEMPQIAKLDLPAGNYAIFAKLVVNAGALEVDPVTRKEFAICKLVAGNDFDNSSALLEVEDDRPTIDDINDGVVLTLEVVHRFSQASEAVLRCSKGAFTGDTPMEIRNLKIIALQAGNISNVFLGGD
jgi:hypothetical protein